MLNVFLLFVIVTLLYTVVKIVKIVRSYHCLFVWCSIFFFFYFLYNSWWIKTLISARTADTVAVWRLLRAVHAVIRSSPARETLQRQRHDFAGRDAAHVAVCGLLLPLWTAHSCMSTCRRKHRSAGVVGGGGFHSLLAALSRRGRHIRRPLSLIFSTKTWV